MPPALNRPPSAIEQAIHRTAINNEKKIITQKEIDGLVADVNVRAGAINFLLATGMLKMMQGDEISYRAVAKKEMEVKKEMTGDEAMVLNHIESVGNRGIWTKHLKAKTELHQTVITRCLKSLEQKSFIKAVDSVEHPTRKMYMMAHLQPAVEVSGGPWYSDKELDTEFIKLLSSACLRFIQEKTFPKSGNNSNHAPLYPVSHSTSYPTAKTVHTWLQKSRLSEQELNVKHVEMLLDVLIYDGQIERLPAYGGSTWNMNDMDDEDDEWDEQSKKRKKKDKKEKGKGKGKGKKTKSKKRSRDATSSEEDDSEDEKRMKKKRKVKEESDASEDEKEHTKKNRKRRRATESESSSDSESESESEEERKKKKKKPSSSKLSAKSRKKKKKSKTHRSDSGTETDSDETNDSSDSESDTKSKSKRTRHKSRKDKEHHDVELDAFAEGTDIAYNNVYRAIRQDRVSLGWSQAPCARCPVFDFCHEDGPVNPKECVYYGDWLQQSIASF